MIPSATIFKQSVKQGPAIGWAPAKGKSLFVSKPGTALGQSSSFGDSALLSLVTDGVATSTAAYLAWGLTARNSRWGAFWWAFTGIAFLKTLNDFSRVGR